MRHARGRPSWGRSTALLASSSAVAHAVLLAGTLVTTRLYAPSELGAGAAFLAVVGVVSVASALRYDFALPVARDDEVPALTALCLVLVASTAATLGAIAIAFGPAAIDALDAPGHLAPLRFAVFPALL